jgi:hypothetical protein
MPPSGCIVQPPNLNNTHQSFTLGIKGALPDPNDRHGWGSESHGDAETYLHPHLERAFGSEIRDATQAPRLWRAVRRVLGCADSTDPIVGHVVYPTGEIFERAVRAVLPTV